METIHEALTELSMLGVVLSCTLGESVRLDRTRLAKCGYVLVFDGLEPRFVRLEEFSYLYDPILYTDDVVPWSSLRSYIVSKIRQEPCSFG